MADIARRSHVVQPAVLSGAGPDAKLEALLDALRVLRGRRSTYELIIRALGACSLAEREVTTLADLLAEVGAGNKHAA